MTPVPSDGSNSVSNDPATTPGHAAGRGGVSGRIPPASAVGEVAERVRARRGGALTPLDLALLHSAPFADGWNTLLGAVRSSMTLRGDLREAAICRIAVLNGAAYEWNAHAPLARSEGVTAAQLSALRDREVDSAALGGELALIVSYTDAMTRTVTVPQELFDAVLDELGVACTVELTSTVAAYNMVSRFLVALDIGRGRPETPLQIERESP